MTRRSIAQAICIMAILSAAAHVALSGELDSIPPWTLALERQLQPWCPGDCAIAVPFTATYEARDRQLVFVGVHHVFTLENNTIRAVDAGFAATHAAAMVIVEGFPTAMGENPAPLVEQARDVGKPNADQFSRGEAMYAISQALARGIPFMGGEPTRAQQVEALGRRGYISRDIAFSYLIGGLSQSIRSGELTGTRDSKLRDTFASWSHAFANQYKLEPLPFDEFAVRYQAMFGVEVANDTALTSRTEAGEASALARLNQADMITRDEHLLGTIESQLASKTRVLVVYGGSHWTTLSQALEARLGMPEVKPFLDTGLSSQQIR